MGLIQNVMFKAFTMNNALMQMYLTEGGSDATFKEGINLISKAVIAFGTIWIVWGLVTLGTGLKDKTGPEIKQGFGTLVGGALIVLAAALLGNVTL